MKNHDWEIFQEDKKNTDHVFLVTCLGEIHVSMIKKNFTFSIILPKLFKQSSNSPPPNPRKEKKLAQRNAVLRRQKLEFLVDPRKLTCQWNIHHLSRCISYWTIGIVQPVMLVFRGCRSTEKPIKKRHPTLQARAKMPRFKEKRTKLIRAKKSPCKYPISLNRDVLGELVTYCNCFSSIRSRIVWRKKTYQAKLGSPKWLDQFLTIDPHGLDLQCGRSLKKKSQCNLTLDSS